MPVVESLIRSESDGSISFGNYKLTAKSKLSDFEHAGDLYKIKTYNGCPRFSRLCAVSIINLESSAHFRTSC